MNSFVFGGCSAKCVSRRSLFYLPPQLLFLTALCLIATVRAQNVSTGQLLAYEPFNGNAGIIDQASGGFGWSSAWQVQNNDSATPGYSTATDSPLVYPGLSQSAAYAVGGSAYLSAGRSLDISAAGAFSHYLNAGLIGAPNITLWVSVLLRKDSNTDDQLSVTLHPNGVAWWTANGQVSFGYFGSASNSGGNRYWSLSVDGTVFPTSVPLVVGEAALLVLELDFGSTADVSFFVNPMPGAVSPGAPGAQTRANNIAFRSLAYYGGDSPSKSSIDEIRLATTYDAVTPVPSPPPSPANVTGVAGDGQVTLSWSAASSTTSYTIWAVTGGSASPIAPGLTSTTFTLKGLTNGTSYSYYVSAANAIGQSPTSSRVTVVPASRSPSISTGLLAYEPFDAPMGALFGASSGAGWAGSWVVQNGSSDTPGYDVSTANPLMFSNLPQSVSHASGGYAYLTSGRSLDVGTTGSFSPYVSNALIGTTGQTVWLSLLIRKDIDNDESNYIVLHGGSTAWYAQTPLVAIGYFGAASNNAGVRYWSLSLKGVVYNTNVPVVSGQTALLVLRIDFNNVSMASLYVNPSPNGVPPSSPDAQAPTSDAIAFRSLAFYGGSAPGQSSIDEIRFADNYVAATSATAVMPAAPMDLAATAGDGQVSLSWSPLAGVTAYQVWVSSGGLFHLLATVTGNNYVAMGLTNKAFFSFYLVAVNSVGTSVPTEQIVSIPRAAVSAKAALGSNLGAVSDSSREWPFVDAFKIARPWISQQQGASWGQGGSLQLTPNGWITALQPGQYVETIIFDNALDDAAADYPLGQYTLLYDGEGTIQFDLGSATILSQTPGRMVVNVPAGQNGIYLMITQTNPANPISNIRFIMPGFESSYKTQPFHPLFLARLQKYKALRYMEWMLTNGSQIQNWADRPAPNDYTYAWRGVPLELMIQLANILHVSPWFNMPHQASDDFVFNFAALTNQQLDPDLKVYIEYSNETWNSQFVQSGYVQSQGLLLGLSQDPVLAGAEYTSLRSVRIFSLWQRAFGGTNQLVRVLAAQAANSWIGQQMLAYQNAFAYTDALAVAPYFSACSDASTGGWGFLGDPSTENQVAQLTVDQVLDIEMSHIQNCAWNEMHSNSAVAANYGVKLVAYEGGQHLVGINGAENNNGLTTLFKAANRDSRMRQLYDLYLQNWKFAGGDLFLHYSDVGAYTKWGNWGALETQDEDFTTAPKYQALIDFANQNP